MSTDSSSRDQTTLVAGGQAKPKNARGEQVMPALTLLHHPNPDRVGDVAFLDHLHLGEPVGISRLEPAFLSLEEGGEEPLSDPFVSRKPVWLQAHPRGAVVVSRGDSSGPLGVDGEPIETSRELSPEDIEQGVVIEVADRVVLLLHRRPVPSETTRSLGLVGQSAAANALRADLQRVAGLDVPVLLRGESGSGKELVAQAIHKASTRRRGPMVAVNMGSMAPSTAASELFGHVRGAFTGANKDRQGFFEQAQGGTLFLDELGETPDEIQAMMLRVLETGELRRVGDEGTRPVDVRVVTATDRDLAAASQEGRFRAPLLHRVAGYQISVPPLRDRRDDIGRLVIYFLKQVLAELGATRLLEVDPSEREPWLGAPLVAQLARAHWSGNVRQLRNVVRQIAIGSHDAPQAHLEAGIEALLLDASARSETPRDSQGEGHSSEGPIRLRVAPEDIDEDTLVEALRENRFKIAATAKSLGISRTSLYGLIEQSPRIRKARDLSSEDILEAQTASGGDLAATAAHLEVSERGLKLRLKELDLS